MHEVVKRGAGESTRCRVTDKRSLMARQFRREYELKSEISGRDAVLCVRKWDSIPMEGVLISGIGILTL